MTGFVLTVLGLALVGAFAVLATGVLRVRGRAPAFVAILVLAAADIVLGAIVLSAVDGVTRLGMLLWHAALAVAAAVLWVRRDRPRLPRPADPLRRVSLGGGGLFAAVIALVVLALQLYVLAKVAPSNWDSMTYHLSRAAYWLQHGSVGHYDGATVRQMASAPNAEILVAWTMLLPGSDKWVEIVQWISLVGLMATIFSGARLLGASAGAGVLAATVFLLLPQTLLQSTTTQNDLVVAFFVAAAMLFLARGARDRHLGDLTIFGLALGLAVGTKTTALMALPALGLAALVAWWAWRPSWGFVGRAAAIAAVGVVALGSFNYIANAVDTGDPFGGLSDDVSEEAKKDPARNLVRVMWSFADTGGVAIPWLDPEAQRFANNVLAPTAGWDYQFTVDTTVHEDTSGFGLVGFFVLPLLLLWALLAPRSPPAARVLAVGVILYLLAFGLRIDENPWVGRLALTAVALAMPLLARLPGAVLGAVLGVALVSGVPSLLSNPAKPLAVPLGNRTVLDWSRLDQMTIFRAEMTAVYDHLKDEIPPDASLALVANEDSWDYPLFGEHRERRIERLAETPESNEEVFAAHDVDAILYLNVGSPPGDLDNVELGSDAYLVLPPERSADTASATRPRSDG
jgi:hypothetical protein